MIPDDLTETPTSPADRPTTIEPKSPLPKSPLPNLEEAADEDKAQEEPKEVVVKREEESEEKEKLEENNMSDSEIARTLLEHKGQWQSKTFFMSQEVYEVKTT